MRRDRLSLGTPMAINAIVSIELAVLTWVMR
jgi:hypothetical protein